MIKCKLPTLRPPLGSQSQGIATGQADGNGLIREPCIIFVHLRQQLQWAVEHAETSPQAYVEVS